VVQCAVLAVDDEILVHRLVTIIVLIVAKLRLWLGRAANPTLRTKTGLDSDAGADIGLRNLAGLGNGEAVVRDSIAIVIESIANFLASIGSGAVNPADFGIASLQPEAKSLV